MNMDTPCSVCGYHCECEHRSIEDYKREVAKRPLCINCKYMGPGFPEDAYCDHPNNLLVDRSYVTGKLDFVHKESATAREQRSQYHECGISGKWFEPLPKPIPMKVNRILRWFRWWK